MSFAEVNLAIQAKKRAITGAEKAAAQAKLALQRSRGRQTDDAILEVFGAIELQLENVRIAASHSVAALRGLNYA